MQCSPRAQRPAARRPRRRRDLGLHLDIIVAHERYATVTEADLRHGMRLDDVQERVTSGRCVDGTFTFGCAETSLRVRGFTVAGDYVMSGLLAPDP